jgi:RNA polymerase sigma-70 factor (ECF subfamily)
MLNYSEGAADAATSSSLSDEELLDRASNGSNECFSVIVSRYQNALQGYLRRYIQDQQLAEDICQETFIAVFTHMQDFEKTKSLHAWIYSIATNKAIDALRKRKRTPEVSLDQEIRSPDGTVFQWMEVLKAPAIDPLSEMLAEETRRVVQDSISCLSDRHQETLLLRLKGEGYRKIAEVLSIPVGTVKSRLKNIRMQLEQDECLQVHVES